MTPIDEHGRAPRRWRFATYNTWNLFEQQSEPHWARYKQVADVIADLDADVVAVQEIRTTHTPHAGELLQRLARAAGMTAELTPAWATEDDAGNATHAIAEGAHTFHTGLMWREGIIEPDPGAMETWGPGTFFHSLIRLRLYLDGQPIDFGSYHAPPFGRQMRGDQAERVLAALTRPSAPMILGGDMNTVGAARIVDAQGNSTWYDPDPYTDVEQWFGDLVFQCDWTWNSDGTRTWWADRRPADILISGGLHDVAAALSEPFWPTTGHHPADEFGQRGIHRRIDHIHTTSDIVLHDYAVVDTPAARQASDHLPVVLTFTL